MNTSRELYNQGFKNGLSAFAHMKNGTYYVGTCGTTLKSALEGLEELYGYMPPDELIKSIDFVFKEIIILYNYQKIDKFNLINWDKALNNLKKALDRVKNFK